MADIIANPGKQIVLTLKLPGKAQVRGNLIAKLEEMIESKEIVSIDARATKLYDVSGMFGTLKPILYISRSMETGGFQRVYASNPATGKNPNWPRFEIPIPALCNCDYARPLLMEVYHFKSSGSHQYVGACQFSLQSITEGNQKAFKLTNEKKRGKDCGTVNIADLQIRRDISFLDYLSGGCSLNLIAAVDFTASNGNPMQPSSLHYLNQN